ncbi:SPOR domain-containing protein [Methylophilus methylotrophus]|uniref:SPOR domain-containing protein n=1 Tax=Methylophilus methylotrophus TaxID=17 RepID=UPI0003788987|nr:SPOR domain-containing protein [Methylophilus methylotrophus]
MKRLFWILLLINVAVFAYFKRDALSPAVSSLKPELHPEQIKLLDAKALESYPKRVIAPTPAPAEPTVTPEEPSPAQAAVVTSPPNSPKTESKQPEPKTPEKTPAKPAETHAPVQTACYEWSGFNMSRVSEAANAAQQLNIKTQTNMTSSALENVRYWIYKPPLATPEAAQAKADELRKLGVEDFFIVQDDPKWRNAISFGVFRDEKLADKLMADLKNKGVKLLIKAPRNGGQAVIKLQQVSAQQFASLEKSRSRFPDTVLKEIPCQ